MAEAEELHAKALAELRERMGISAPHFDRLIEEHDDRIVKAKEWLANITPEDAGASIIAILQMHHDDELITIEAALFLNKIMEGISTQLVRTMLANRVATYPKPFRWDNESSIEARSHSVEWRRGWNAYHDHIHDLENHD